MKHLLQGILILSFSLNIFSQNSLSTKKQNFEYIKHGLVLNDEYSWLENTTEPEVTNWIENQNIYSSEHLNYLVKKYDFLFKIKDYSYLSTNSLPSKKGRYFYTNYRLQKDQPYVLHYREKLNDSPRELVNPYKIFKNKNVLINGYYPSKNSKYLAYKYSLDGSDRHNIKFVDIIKQNNLEDELNNIKFSNVSWNEDKGIFYKKNNNKDFFAKDSTYQLYYHVIGNNQIKDELIFDASKEESSFSFFTKENKLFIIEKNKEETSKNYYYADLNNEKLVLNKFISESRNNITFLNYKNGKVYFSSKKSDWGDIKAFDINNPEEEFSIIPQIYSHLLIDTDFLDEYIICKYRNLDKNYINVYNYDGSFVRKFEAPMQMDFNIKFYDSKTKNLFVTFYSYTISYINYKLNIETGETSVYYNDYISPKPTLFPFDHFETKTITFKSRDNKSIPITIVHKKNITLDGNNPTILKAYGGFGVISGVSYDVGLLHFLEKGGIYAFASIRGGGEKGRKWHTSGMGSKKINSFNDFIDAAEFLIDEKYTSPNKLAITGASNGGLVVGVAMTMRPDLFKVAVPKVGVFDMAKYDQYTTGKFHLDEFGDPEIEEEFNNLLLYSPYHNIKEDINYPTTLIITSENDDRVPPIHSYKFAAKLQNRAAQKNPIYLKVMDNSGHYGKVSNYKDAVAQESEFYSFIWEHLNN
jgi:prolyl oligopeptidase